MLDGRNSCGFKAPFNLTTQALNHQRIRAVSPAVTAFAFRPRHLIALRVRRVRRPSPSATCFTLLALIGSFGFRHVLHWS